MIYKEFTFRRNIKNKSYYGGIVLELETTEAVVRAGSLEVGFTRDVVIEYKQAVVLGAEYFFDHYHEKNFKLNLKINVLLTRTLLVDTPSIIIMYATIMAVCEALQFSIENLDINQEGILLLPLPIKVG